MGKQSRKQKNNKKKSKEEHKRDLQERQRRKEQQERQRFLGEAFEENDDGNDRINEWTLMKGDRVWIKGKLLDIFDENNPDTYRGIIISMSLDRAVVNVRPLSFPENSTPVALPIENVFRDVWGLTLERKVGDTVFCNTKGGLRPGVVTHLWPLWEVNNTTSNN